MSPSKRKTIKRSRSIKSMTRNMRNKRRTLNTLLSMNDQSLRLIKYLKIICSDSCGCLSFGRENEKIKALFNGFNNFNYSLGKAKKIQDKSVNGFAYEIKFLRNIKGEEYESSALLKSAVKKKSDNLYYEYIVGYSYINKVNLLYPCFTETYHLLENKSNELKEYMQNNNEIDVDNLKGNFENLNKYNIANSCKNSDKLSIMVQYIKNPLSFHKYLDFRQKVRDINLPYELTQILFQIYGPLSKISKEYTHYDLHSSNMLIYELDEGKYITMNYIYDNYTIHFKTNKISKIIDYGRSFFYLDSTMNTLEIYKRICEEKSCISKCGNDVGYKHLSPQSELSISTSNISQDLRLANMIRSYKLPIIGTDIHNVLKKIQFNGKFTTYEHLSIPNNNDIIFNVDDMQNSLKELIKKTDFISNNERQFDSSVSVGSLDIYMNENREMLLTGINIKGKKNTPTPISHSTKNISTKVWKTIENSMTPLIPFPTTKMTPLLPITSTTEPM
jgi:hypothetical protein